MDYKVYSYKQMLSDLEPYHAYPKDELCKIIKLLFMLILFNIHQGKRVNIPYFGEFSKKWTATRPVYNSRKEGICHVPPREVVKFKASPFTRWVICPTVFGEARKYRQSRYYIFMEKIIHELWFHKERYDIESMIPPMKNPEIIAEYNSRKGKKPRKLGILR